MLSLIALALAEEPTGSPPPAPAAETPAPTASETPPPPASPAPLGPPVVASLAADLDSPSRKPWEVDIHVAGIVLENSALGEFNRNGATTAGLRVGYRVAPWITPFVGASANGAGMSHFVEEGDTGDLFQTAYYQDQFFGGLKSAWSPLPYFGVYGLAQGQLVLGILRIDDDPDVDDNPGQIELEGATGGLTAALGVQAAAPVRGDRVDVTFHMEVGYAWNAPLELGDVATLNIQGVFIRTGAGARF